VRGNIIGKKVQLLRTGRVWGDIRAMALTTEEGAFIDGKITMLGQEPPAVETEAETVEEMAVAEASVAEDQVDAVEMVVEEPIDSAADEITEAADALPDADGETIDPVTDEPDTDPNRSPWERGESA
jgi:hypothetical protein